MTGELARVALLQELKALRNVRFSVMATYNAFFPFYEEIVLRRLIAAGSRVNILLVDAEANRAALADPEIAPRRAGSEYLLVPAQAMGAFHPKLLMAGDKDQAHVWIGSHNATLSGFGVNREVTNGFHGRPSQDPVVARAGWDVWRFVRGWLPDLPEDVETYASSPERFAPWLREEPPVADGPRVFGTHPGTADLWSQTEPMRPPNVDRAVVIGPFFDARLAFIARVRSDCGVRDVVAAIEPDTAALPIATARIDPHVRVVDASSAGEREGYLHAKAVWLAGPDGSFLATGSANPSAPAWLESERRNAELVVVRTGAAADAAADALGLPALLDEAKPLDEAGWSRVGSRAPAPGEDRNATRPAALLAFLRGCILEGSWPAAGGEAIACTLRDAGGKPLSGPIALVIGSDGAWSFAVPEARGLASAHLGGANREALCWVVQTADLLRLAESDRRRRLNATIRSFAAGLPNIEELLRVVEEIVFDPTETVGRPGIRRAPADHAEHDSAGLGDFGLVEEEQELGEEDEEKQKNAGGEARGDARGPMSDLEVLLQALRVRFDLEPSRQEPEISPLSSEPSVATEDGGPDPDEDPLEPDEDGALRSEEEEVGVEEETTSEEVDPEEAAKIVRRSRQQVRSLVHQVERWAQGGPGASQELAARLHALVLLLATLKAAERGIAWLPDGEVLIEREPLERMFHLVLKTVWRARSSSDKSAAGPGGHGGLESSLAWLTWTTGRSGQRLDRLPRRGQTWYGTTDHEGLVADAVLQRAESLAVFEAVLDRPGAPAETEALFVAAFGPDESEEACTWLREHLAWVGDTRARAEAPDAPLPPRAAAVSEPPYKALTLRPGDVVLRKSGDLRVVLEGGSGRAQLWDLGGKPNRLKRYPSILAVPMTEKMLTRVG